MATGPIDIVAKKTPSGIVHKIKGLSDRTIAWIFHDASLALDMIAVEIIVSVILYVASSKLSEQD